MEHNLTPTKDRALSIRFSQPDFLVLEELAKKSNLTYADVIRKALLQYNEFPDFKINLEELEKRIEALEREQPIE